MTDEIREARIQRAPSDDAIIAEHIDEAYFILQAALRRMRAP